MFFFLLYILRFLLLFFPFCLLHFFSCSFWLGLLVKILLSFPSSNNVFIFISFLKGIFTGYRILSWQFCSLSTWKIATAFSSPWFLVWLWCILVYVACQIWKVFNRYLLEHFLSLTLFCPSFLDCNNMDFKLLLLFHRSLRLCLEFLEIFLSFVPVA